MIETTRLLLNHWFRANHRLPNGARFAYHDSQRGAIETLIYVYEVARARTRTDLLERFAAAGSDLRLPAYGRFARYCAKMATGSGKTKVMSLAIAWQYFNAVREELHDYARTFLVIAPNVIAPNVIVFERLKTDFAGGRIFRADPVIPFSRPTAFDAGKCIYNLAPCENEFERAFARFLQDTPDVAAFAKLPDPFNFCIEYTDAAANLRLYYPDFVARLESGEHWLLETKGQENVDVARKDAAATLWCENATALTGVTWRYLKVGQKAFATLQPHDFTDLLALASRD